jgi:hypothetical protein
MIYKTINGRYALIFKGVLVGLYESREDAIRELLAAKGG